MEAYVIKTLFRPMEFSLKSHRIPKRLVKALIRLRVCAGWSEGFAGRTYHIVAILMSRLNYVFFSGLCILNTPDRRQSKTLILSTNVDQK